MVRERERERGTSGRLSMSKPMMIQLRLLQSHVMHGLGFLSRSFRALNAENIQTWIGQVYSSENEVIFIMHIVRVQTTN